MCNNNKAQDESKMLTQYKTTLFNGWLVWGFMSQLLIRVGVVKAWLWMKSAGSRQSMASIVWNLLLRRCDHFHSGKTLTTRCLGRNFPKLHTHYFVHIKTLFSFLFFNCHLLSPFSSSSSSYSSTISKPTFFSTAFNIWLIVLCCLSCYVTLHRLQFLLHLFDSCNFMHLYIRIYFL